MIDAHPDPDVPDSYYIEYDPDAVWQQQDAGSEFGESEMYDDPGSVQPGESEWAEGEGDWGEEGEGGEDDGEGDEQEEGEMGDGTLDE